MSDIHKIPLGVKIAVPGWTVYSVNGTAVRNTHDPDFSGFALAGDTSYVPDGEVWIENTRPFESMLKDVTAAEKRAAELVPEPDDSSIKLEEDPIEPPPDPLAHLEKVSNQRFFRGIRYVTKEADFNLEHQEELLRGLQAFAKSEESMGKGKAPSSPAELLSWLFQAQDPKVQARFQKSIKGPPRNESMTGRPPGGDTWGSVDEMVRGSGQPGAGDK